MSVYVSGLQVKGDWQVKCYTLKCMFHKMASTSGAWWSDKFKCFYWCYLIWHSFCGRASITQNSLGGNAVLFNPVLGHCVTMKVTLILNDDATPKFCKPCKLPFALKSVTGDEVECLESYKAGLLFWLGHSDCGDKKNKGKVCICGDFKITVNPLLKIDIIIPTTTSWRTIWVIEWRL